MSLLIKRCRECGVEKPLSEYYSATGMKDGHLNKCKVCTRRRITTHRNENLESIRDYDQKRRKGVVRVSNDTSAYRSKNPDKYRAHNKVNNALRDGKITKPKLCESCSEEKRLNAHHWSYEVSNWLDVEWLCTICHGEEHKRLRLIGKDPDGEVEC